MRSYFTLLRLPYQFSLAPIFLLGYWRAGGAWRENFAAFLVIFLAFHVGAFGGLTALNSAYDRDSGPIGGLWNPPRPPQNLLIFAFLVQSAGFLTLWIFSPILGAMYAAICLLALGYSHPNTRWKGHPFMSLLVVVLGQGALDFTAGVFTASRPNFSPAVLWGGVGVCCVVTGFYPLSQLFQLQTDRLHGDKTLALWLFACGGRNAIFRFAAAFLVAGLSFITVALQAPLVIFALGGFGWFLARWQSEPGDAARDFRRVHWLQGTTAASFAIYLISQLLIQ